MIPRKLALRIWAATCQGHAAHLTALAAGCHDEPGRADRRGRSVSPTKAPGRLAYAALLRRWEGRAYD